MDYSQQIKDYASSIGFDACGICEAGSVDSRTVENLSDWVDRGYNADMAYLARNQDKRCNPALLVENARSVICVALNYYPQTKQREDVPQFAYYAYGLDYHDEMKARLQRLYSYIEQLMPQVSGRFFCDTAPVLERYWAAKAGLGFIGKNTLLIRPGGGSYFFLGEIIIDAILEYDKPLDVSCGKCVRCLEACPTKALEKPHLLNSNKCISYQTIENRGEIAANIKPLLGNCFYGCDICQQVCPWNRFAAPHTVEAFDPKPEFLSLDFDALKSLSEDQYRAIFKGSAVKRAKYSGLKRNISALENLK